MTQSDRPSTAVFKALLSGVRFHQKLKQLQYLPSETCDDATFIRRLSLDLRGLLPTIDETSRFLVDQSPTRRSALIDQFLNSPEYPRFWGLRLSDLLRINTDKLSSDRATAYSRWVAKSLERNEPYDRFVGQLLTSSGGTDDHPAANFYRTTPDSKTVTETVAQIFMGSRVLCAQCHNHPYESWTQDNYYQIAAAFHEVDRKVIPNEDPKPEDSKRNRKYMTQQPYPLLTSFLTSFGQPPRETACACERREEANLDRALQMMNSSLIRSQVSHAAARIERESPSNEILVRDLYLAALSRLPRDVEVSKLSAHLATAPDRRQGIEDLIWALINTNEFMFQH